MNSLSAKQKKRFAIITYTLVGLLYFSCNAPSSHKQVVEESSSGQTNLVDSANNRSLSKHWDSFDFNDTLSIRNPEQTEQRFVDYVNSFRHYPIQEVSASIHEMLDKAAVNPTVYNYFKDQYAHYLYDPNSPMRNETYYESVLNYLVSSANSNSTEKIRYQMQLDMVRKNQPGNFINNVEYLNSNNKKEFLHDTKGKIRLIIFYDPTCSHCKEVMNVLKTSEALNSAITQEQLQVIAIDPAGDETSWKAYQDQIPSNWTNGFDKQSNVINKQLFNIAAYPTLYLIDQNNTVVLKDPDYQLVLQLLQQQTPKQ